MKTNAIVRIVLWSIVLLLLLSILGGFLAFGIYSVHSSETSWVTPIITSGTGTFQQNDYTASDSQPVTQIEIEWAAGTITIQPGDTDHILLSESGKYDADEAMVYHQYGGKLTIECQEQDVFFGFQSTVSKDLTITVPRDWQGQSISINAASAQLNVTGIMVRELELDSASGIAIFEDCTIGELDIDTASGDVTYSGTLDTLEFDAMSAKFTAVFTATPSRMALDSMSGDVDITLPESCGFTATIDAMSSDFSSDFEVTKKNNQYIYGDGSCRIALSAMSGDVNIRKGK